MGSITVMTDKNTQSVTKHTAYFQRFESTRIIIYEGMVCWLT
jgi:hypothetical protein